MSSAKAIFLLLHLNNLHMKVTKKEKSEIFSMAVANHLFTLLLKKLR